MAITSDERTLIVGESMGNGVLWQVTVAVPAP
jgi:hypothetical protein